MPRILVLAFLVAESIASAQAPITIRMGTLAPQKSKWYDLLAQMGEEWKTASGGKVELVIYPGGEQGDEPTMIDKMRIRKLQAVALSGAGLGDIEPGVNALQVPMLIQSNAELDYVRDSLAPELERRIARKGFVVLNWGDAGWIYYFTKKPITHPDDLKKLKLCVIAGDNRTLEIYRANGFRPEVIASTDVLSGLKTGLVEAFSAPPLLAAANLWFGPAPNMLDIKWAPLVGGTLINKDVWDKLPPPTRKDMMKAAAKAGEGLRNEIRQLGSKAVDGMQAFGLRVAHPDAATEAEWQKFAESIYPAIRGKIVPADLFDEAKKLRDQYRAKAGGSK